jgi:hypothetical protein
MLIGAPLAVFWWMVVIVLAVATGSTGVLVTYLTITVLGLITYPELRARVPMLRNAWRRRSREDADAIGGWMRASIGGGSHV